MNKEIIRKKIENIQGQKFNFIFNGSRNQTEKFYGTIIETFPSIFLIKTNDINKKIKSFSYNDIISSHLQIIQK